MKLGGKKPIPTPVGKQSCSLIGLSATEKDGPQPQPLGRKGVPPGTYKDGCGVVLPGDFRPSKPNAERGELPRWGLKARTDLNDKRTPPSPKAFKESGSQGDATGGNDSVCT